MEKTKVVTIHSDVDRFVYGTNFSVKTGDGKTLKNSPSTWTETRILIKKGIFDYPAEIADWESVKVLLKAGKLTISTTKVGEVSDEKTTKAVKAKENADKLEKNEKVKDAARVASQKKLEDTMNALNEASLNEILKQTISSSNEDK